MSYIETIENYMLQMGIEYEPVGENMWVVNDEIKIVVVVNEPVIYFRTKIMDLPSENQEALFRKLLEYNAVDMLHGAYGIEDKSVVMIDSLQVENLDLNEFQASIEAMSMAFRDHYGTLSEFYSK